MTPDQFIQKSKAYYGPYNREQEKTVRAWLSQKNEKYLPLIYSEVLKALSPVYKTPPGIMELEASFKEVIDHRAHEVERQPTLQIEEDIGDVEKGKAFLSALYKKLGGKRT